MRRVALASILSGCLGLAGLARAQEPALAGMDRATWTARDGAPQGVTVLAQAPDGTLWVGTEGGLFNFDGHTFTAFQSRAGEPELPPEAVRSLLVTRDGTLWVGLRRSGSARISRGRVAVYNKTDKQPLIAVDQLCEARDGTVWAIGNQMTLIRFSPRDTVWRVEPRPPQVTNARLGGMYVDSANVLWLAQDGRLFRRQLPETTYTTTDVPADFVFYFAAMPGGDIWMTGFDTHGGFGRTQRIDRSGKQLVSLRHPNDAAGILYTADGSLILAFGEALYRYRADALTGQAILPVGPPIDSTGSDRALVPGATSLLLDSEHNIWVGGRRGLDRLRAPRLVPLIGGNMAAQWTLCADVQGNVFATSTMGTFYTVVGGRTRRLAPDTARSVSCGNDGITRVWGGKNLWELHGSRFERLPSIPGLPPYSLNALVATSDHTLYAMVGGNTEAFGGVWQYKNGQWTKITGKGYFQHAGQPFIDSRNRLWMGYNGGPIGLPLEGRLFGSGRPGLGAVFAFLETARGLFAAGTNGVAVLRDSSFEMLSFADRTSTRAVAGLLESKNGDLWLNAVRGIVRVPAAELAGGLANPRYPMKSERVTEGDFTGPAYVSDGGTTVARAANGTLWFSMLNGVVGYNPDAPHPTGKPPILSIKSITADRVPLDERLTFGPQPRTLTIQYLGVNLAAPDRVRYRYRLDGFDDEWQDAGARREAIYTRPGPGRYTFRVMAANERGEWTAPVASAPFTVLPNFYQTTWFAALISAGVVALVWLAYTLRVRSITTIVQARAEERADERVRVARELHDTLLGDMAGVAMQLNAGARRVEASDAANGTIVELLSSLSRQVQRSLVEARRSVTAMRVAPEALPPLHEQLADAARRTFAGTAIAVHVEHRGAPRSFAPNVEAETLGIATEAMSNARKHGGCQTVTVICSYASRALEVRVRDDGRGFDPAQAPPAGHWGLIGMRERAASVGGTLAVTSAPDAGTEVRLIVGVQHATPELALRGGRTHAAS